MLSAAAVYGNELYWYELAIYSRICQVILGPAESVMPWIYCYLPDVELIYNAFFALN